MNRQERAAGAGPIGHGRPPRECMKFPMIPLIRPILAAMDAHDIHQLLTIYFGVKAMKIGNFLSDESGAVIVDWTVLAAAIVGLGIATVAAVRTGVVDLGDDINGSLSSASVVSLGALGSGGTDGIADLFSYETLSETGAQNFDSWVEAIANITEAEQLEVYSTYMAYAIQAMEGGDMAGAAIYLDVVGATRAAIQETGGQLADDAPSLQDALDRYGELTA